ncbi:HlyD family secretion protein [Bradyrhizobium sp. 61]|uniref:HlyD family secretion protein n=1 Tax=unclassified Bradyrhizobium TaxID=2631580 RepID=UPI001FFA0BC6|nr:HlyD family secretion protein [Bradyrhizobium sp. 61]MCK1448833.1 HlyD family secretion protein [Bradyrhizobium sp. 48]
MIAFLIVIYCAVVLVLFKVLHLKPRPYLIACMALAGILMIGGVVVAWTQSAPLTGQLVTTQYVVQLVPYVKGQVKAVHAEANQPMKKGDLLLEIDPAPYQYTVDQLEAQLKASKANVEQAQAGAQAGDANVAKAKAGIAQSQAAIDEAKAAVANAQASLNKAKAAADLAKTQEQIALNIQRADVAAISQLKVAEAKQQRQEADAAVQQAAAAVTQAQAAEQQASAGLTAAQSAMQQTEAAARQAAFAIVVAQSNVPGVEAQLGDARFNLAQCRMTAPADGYVVNWQVQVGTMLVPMPLAAAGTFIDTSNIAVAAVFPQNWLANVKLGDDVELVLDPYPGRLFTGKVNAVIPASGGGQFTTSGDIPTAAKVGSTGAYAVKILFDDSAVSRNLSIGSGGSAAIYTQVGKPTHIISKVAMRMKKWLLYVAPTVAKA